MTTLRSSPAASSLPRQKASRAKSTLMGERLSLTVSSGTAQGDIESVGGVHDPQLGGACGCGRRILLDNLHVKRNRRCLLPLVLADHAVHRGGRSAGSRCELLGQLVGQSGAVRWQKKSQTKGQSKYSHGVFLIFEGLNDRGERCCDARSIKRVAMAEHGTAEILPRYGSGNETPDRRRFPPLKRLGSRSGVRGQTRSEPRA